MEVIFFNSALFPGSVAVLEFLGIEARTSTGVTTCSHVRPPVEGHIRVYRMSCFVKKLFGQLLHMETSNFTQLLELIIFVKAVCMYIIRLRHRLTGGYQH
jgi:hypothetical protein